MIAALGRRHGGEPGLRPICSCRASESGRLERRFSWVDEAGGMEQIRGGAAARSTLHRRDSTAPRSRNEEQWLERLELNRDRLLELSQRLRERHAADDQAQAASSDETLRDGDAGDKSQLVQDGADRDAMLRLLSQNSDQIDHALVRRGQGAYGYCEDCGAPIPAERLAIRPEATRCVPCQAACE